MYNRTISIFKNAYSGLPSNIWLLSFAMFINRMGTMVFPYLSLYLTQSLGFSLVNAGIVLSVYGLGALCGTFLGGVLTDRFGYHWVQVGSLLFAGLMLLIIMWLQSFTSICIFIFIYTTLADTFRPANATAIAQNSNENDKTRAFTLNRLAINLGWSIGAGLGGFMAFYNYKLLFVVDGITCIMSGLFLLFYLTPQASHYIKKEKDVVYHKIQSPFTDFKYLYFSFLVFLFALSFFLLFSVLPVYFKTKLFLTELQIGLLQTLNGIIIVLIEMFLIIWLEKHFAKNKIIAFGLFFTGLSYFVLNIVAFKVIVLLALVLVTFGEMFAMPFMMSSTVARANSQNMGKYLSVYAMSYSLAQVSSPIVGTWVAQHYGYSVLWNGTFGMCVLAGLGFWFLKKF